MTLLKLFAIGFTVFVVLAIAGSVVFGITQAEAGSSREIAIGPLVVVDARHDEHTDELTLGPGIAAIGALGGGANAALGAAARRSGTTTSRSDSADGR